MMQLVVVRRTPPAACWQQLVLQRAAGDMLEAVHAAVGCDEKLDAVPCCVRAGHSRKWQQGKSAAGARAAQACHAVL